MPDTILSTRLEDANCFCGASDTLGSPVIAKDGAETFSYWTCATCGAQRLSPRPRPEDIGSYYPDSYASHVIRPKSFSVQIKHLVYLAYYSPENLLGPFRLLIKLLLYPVRGHTVFAFNPIAPKRVFEFGAATGNDLDLFRSGGWQVSGCEPSARACAIAKERDIQLQNCPAETADLPPKAYPPSSSITCWSTLTTRPA